MEWGGVICILHRDTVYIAGVSLQEAYMKGHRRRGSDAEFQALTLQDAYRQLQNELEKLAKTAPPAQQEVRTVLLKVFSSKSTSKSLIWDQRYQRHILVGALIPLFCTPNSEK